MTVRTEIARVVGDGLCVDSGDRALWASYLWQLTDSLDRLELVHNLQRELHCEECDCAAFLDMGLTLAEAADRVEIEVLNRQAAALRW